MRFLTLFVVLTILLTTAEAQSSAKRPVRPDDYNNVASVTDPHLSPDGKYVAYVVTKVNAHSNHRQSAIWIAAVDGITPPRQFAFDASSSSPRWSPDGQSIAFLSARSDAGEVTPKTQIYVLRLDGGDARRIGSLSDGVSAFEWSPDGKRFVCVSRPALASSANKSDFKDYRGSAIKLNGAGYFDNRRTHIFVMDAVTGDARALTSDPHHNDTEPQWSPDGSAIAFISNNIDESLFESMDVMTIPASGGTPVRVNESRVFCEKPRWSPDGKRISYVAMITDAGTPRIFIASASGGAKSVLASASLSLPPGEYDWTDDGAAIDAALSVRGEHQIFRIDLATGKFAPLTSGPHSITAFDSAKHTAHTVLISNDPTIPAKSSPPTPGSKRAPAHASQRSAARQNRVSAGRTHHLQKRGRHVDRRLLHEAAGMAGRQDLPDGGRRSWRT